MGRLEKYVFGEARVRNLITGIVILFIAVALILWTYLEWQLVRATSL